VRVQPSLTFKTHNASRVSDSYTSQRVPITDTLASHFTLAHSDHSAAAHSYQTTTGASHTDPSTRVQPARSAGTVATNAADFDIVFHRARINPHIAPFEHYKPDVSVRRYIPKSSQDSYNIVTGESIPKRTPPQAAPNV
jgi:hypothetical protein